MGMVAVLVNKMEPFEKNFFFPSTVRLDMKFGSSWPTRFKWEDVWKCWWMTDACLYYKPTFEPLAQVG